MNSSVQKLSSFEPKPFRVLLVEDNEGDVDLTREAMKNCNSSILLSVASDGVKAMEYLRHQLEESVYTLPDLILLDLNLPKKDGRQVLSEIKSDRFLKSIPTVVLTSSDAETDISKSYFLGANSYVVKPVSYTAYQQIIELLDEFWFNTSKLPTKDSLAILQKHSHSNATSSKAIPLSQSQTIQILLIEDNPADADLVKEYLRNQATPKFSVAHVSRLSDALDYFKSNPGIDVILTDLGLPDSQGADTLATIHSKFPNIPVVVLSGDEDQSLALNALKNDAQEFLVKGQISSTFLPRVIQYALKRKEQELEKVQFLAQQQALRAEAENAVQLRDEFLSIASHELKTPLTALKLQIQLLTRVFAAGSDDPKAKVKATDLLLKADGQLTHYTNLIDTLLDITRIQSGRLQLEKGEVDLVVIVKEVLEQVSYDMKIAGCQVTTDMPPELKGNWDSGRIEQVLLNLLTNAKKYAAGKPVEIKLSQAGNRAILEVVDHGSGIHKTDQEKIFERFERVTKSTTVKGLGLGLYIVRQIIDAHGGSIRVESDFGHGSKFIISLPVRIIS